MSHFPRLDRLRALADRVDNQPRSEECDALLLEIRGRIVALDTGGEVSSRWFLAPQPPPDFHVPQIRPFFLEP